MRRTSCRLVTAPALAALAFLVFAGPAADAQTPSAPDAALAAQKAAFLALPEGTRKATQDALVWLGFYNGVADGDFGPRTRDAILAFQASAKAPADGALTAPEIKALLAAAQKARDAVGFKVVADSKTGAKAGAPTRLIGGRNGARLDFASSAEADLGALYARLSAPNPTRRIAYKAIKPDAFFVVSGRDATGGLDRKSVV
jgi:peptidoglycan hydrolase-like protein with peptidoglycan-binding domain